MDSYEWRAARITAGVVAALFLAALTGNLTNLIAVALGLIVAGGLVFSLFILVLLAITPAADDIGPRGRRPESREQ